MLVRQEDFDNLSVYQKDLPVRRGCGFGPCACTGYCDLIIGWIDRDTYSSFMKSYVSVEDFISKNYMPDNTAIIREQYEYDQERARQEKNLWIVHMRHHGDNKMEVIKTLKKYVGISLSESLKLINMSPVDIKHFNNENDAERLQFQLQTVGATVEY